MSLIEKRQSSAAGLRIPNLTACGGVLAIVGGAGHTVTAAVYRRDVWSQVIDDGPVKALSLHPSADQLAAAEAFWFSLGSFGIPLLLLGSVVTWLTRRGQRVPGWLGLGIAGWALLLAPLGGFDLGSMLILLMGVLIAAGARQSR
jgi:hypothetical protein